VALIGAGVGSYLAVSGDDHTGQSVALAAYQSGSIPAKATINGGHIALDAHALPKMAGKRYEVWLTNSARTQMQPIGWIAADGHANMSVPTDLIARFSDIEVSVQSVSAPSYLYSNVSVLRGAYSD
jgi:hypothetical protein